jgi:hypothetical protein
MQTNCVTGGHTSSKLNLLCAHTLHTTITPSPQPPQQIKDDRSQLRNSPRDDVMTAGSNCACIRGCQTAQRWLQAVVKAPEVHKGQETRHGSTCGQCHPNMKLLNSHMHASAMQAYSTRNATTTPSNLSTQYSTSTDGMAYHVMLVNHTAWLRTAASGMATTHRLQFPPFDPLHI